MSEREEIRAPKLIVVEGRHDVAFFKALIDHMSSSTEIASKDFQVTLPGKDRGGKTEQRPFVKALAQLGVFRETVMSIGIVRDADDNPEGAFQTVKDLLVDAGLPCPSAPYQSIAGPPRVAIAILPDAARKGMLETLCVESVQETPAMQCVEEYLDCLQMRCNCTLAHLWKARAQAFLASCPRPDLRVGEAAQKGYWNWDSPVFNQLKDFLRSL